MCLNPKKATLVSYSDNNGEVVQKLIFGQNLPVFGESKEIDIACGKCYECQLQYSLNWANRCLLESSLYKNNVFITLTFATTDGVLEKRPLQLFLKRLRKHFTGQKIRYFACGEYGSKNQRPHYHLIIFNCDFVDKYLFNPKERLYRSPTLEKLWPFGFSSIGEVNEKTCLYVSKYMQKIDSNQKKGFITMSLKPGIGFDAIKKENQNAIIYINGEPSFMPRYYIDKLNRLGYIINKKAIYSIMEKRPKRDLEKISQKYLSEGLTLHK